MDPNIRDIIDFVGNARNMSLVSRDWRSEILSNERDILDGLERSYPGMQLPDIVIISIHRNDINTIRRLLLLRSGIDWNDSAYFVMKEGSDRILLLVLPHLNYTNRAIVAGRRGITLESYVDIEHTLPPYQTRITQRERGIFNAIAIGDANQLLDMTPMGSRDNGIILKVLNMYLSVYGILPKTIMNHLLYRFTEGSIEYSPNDTELGIILKDVMRVFLHREDPPAGWVDHSDALDHWTIEGRIYASLVLLNDDAELFGKILKDMRSDDIDKFLYMGGRRIIRCARTHLFLLKHTLGINTIYQPLDMQYFIDTILNMVFTTSKGWVDSIMKLSPQYRAIYKINEEQDAISYLMLLRDKAISVALVNGWTHLIRGLIDRNNIVGVTASIQMYKDIELPPQSIQVLNDIGTDTIPFISLFTDQPQISRSLWKKLLATATAYDNPSMIEILMDLPYELSEAEMENLSSIINKLPTYRQIRIRRIFNR